MTTRVSTHTCRLAAVARHANVDFQVRTHRFLSIGDREYLGLRQQTGVFVLSTTNAAPTIIGSIAEPFDMLAERLILSRQNLVCDRCRRPTFRRHPGDNTITCCMEPECATWVQARLNFRNTPELSWEEID